MNQSHTQNKVVWNLFQQRGIIIQRIRALNDQERRMATPGSSALVLAEIADNREILGMLIEQSLQTSQVLEERPRAALHCAAGIGRDRPEPSTDLRLADPREIHLA